jgi:tetratricopeptide (TPR) repeat protein
MSDLIYHRFKKGESFYKLSMNKAAIEIFDQIIEMNSKDQTINKNCFLMKGNCLTRLNKYQESINCYDKILEMDPENITVLNYKASALKALNKKSESRELFNYVDRLNRRPNDPDLKRNKAISYAGLGMHEESINYFEKCLDDNPKDSLAYLKLGNLYQDLNEHKEAIQYYDKAIKLNASFNTAHINKGISLYRINSKDALDSFNIALEINDKDIFALFNKGVILSDLGEYTESINCFDKIIEQDSNDSKAYMQKANSLNGLKLFDDAIKCIEKSLELEPDSAEAYVIKGISLTKLLNLSKALDCFKKAIEIDSNFYIAEKYKNQLTENLNKITE